jgi:hypothetical protein
LSKEITETESSSVTVWGGGALVRPFRWGLGGSVFYGQLFFAFFNLKNMIWTHTQDFCKKVALIIQIFSKKFNPQIFTTEQIPEGSQNVKEF